MALRYSSSSCVAPLLLLLLLLPTAVPFSAVTPVMKLRCEWVGCSWGCRHARAHSIATPGVCALTAMADFEVGDRVKFLVNTVRFSRKVTSNGMTSTDLTGVPPSSSSDSSSCLSCPDLRVDGGGLVCLG